MLKKLLLASSIILISVFALVGCKKDTTLQTAKEKLQIQFAEGETKDTVTKNLVLPLKDGEVSISWVSNNETVISINANEGVVTRQGEDTQVVLKAVLTYKEKTEQKNFTVTVLKSDDALINEIKNELARLYVFQDGKYTKDLELVNKVKGVDVTWTSNKPEFFSNDGKLVKRPTHTEGNQAVTLTASFLNTNKIFVFVIEAEAPTPAEEIKSLMLSVINFSSDPLLKGNLKLDDKKSITYKGQELPIVWTSSDVNVLTNEGVVVEFEGENKPVTMTATVTTEIDGQTVTVELKYNFMVAPTQIFATIKETMKKDLIDKTVVVGQISLYKKVTDKDGVVSGYYLVDKEGTLAYVNGEDLKGIQENKKYKLKAVVGHYYGAMQYSVLNVTELEDGKFEAVAVEKTITDITSLQKPSKNNPDLVSVLYKLTNVKVFSKGNGNYDLKLALHTVENNDGLTFDNSITIYYKSNKEVVDKLVGKTINEIHIINRGYRSDQNTWYVDFIGTADEIELSLTDEERLTLAIKTAEDHITRQVLFKEDHNADFAQIKFKGVTFEFTSDNPSIVDNTGKVVSLPAALQDLSIHVVAKLENGQQKTGDFKLKVGQLAEVTVDQTYNLNKGEYAIVEVVVTKNLGSGNYAVQDTTSTKGGNLRPGKTKVEIGKKYKFVTQIDEYNQLKQLKLVELLETSEGTIREVEFNDVFTTENQLANLLQLLKVKELKVKELFKIVKAGDNTVVGKLEDANNNVISVRIHKTIYNLPETQALLTLAVGDIVYGQIVISAFKNSPQVAYANFQKVTNMEKAERKIKEFDNKEYKMDTTVELPNKFEELNAVITYTYEPNDAITLENKWKVVTEDTVVNLTARIQIDEEVKNVTLKVTIKYVNPETVEEKIKKELQQKYVFPDGKYEKDLDLVNELFGVAITWESDQTEFFSNAGKLVRKPSFTEGDVTVNLTARFNADSFTFTFIIEKLPETLQEKVQREFTNKFNELFNLTPNVLIENIDLSTLNKVTVDGVEYPINWTSSNQQAMLDSGTLVQFVDETRKTKLTAKIAKDEINLELSKEFIVAPTHFTTFEKLLVKDNVTNTFKVQGVSFFAFVGNPKDKGYYIADSTGKLAYIHDKKPTGLKEGKKYDVTARVDEQYGNLQLALPKFVNEQEGVVKPVAEELTINQITGQTVPTAKNPGYVTKYVKFTNVKVMISGTDNYNTFLTLIDATEVTQTNSINIYYKSNKDAFTDLNGKVLEEVYLVQKGHHNDHNCWYFDFVGKKEEIKVQLTETEKLDAALEVAKKHIEKQVLYKVGQSAKLNEITYEGVTFTFESLDAATLNNNGEVLVLPATLESKQIKVTVQIGSTTKEATYELKVGQLAVTSTDAFYGLEVDTFILVQVTVFANLGSGNFAGQDETNTPQKGINLRPGTLVLEVGKTYKVYGIVKEFNQLKQLEAVDVEEITTKPVQVVDFTLDPTKENLLSVLLNKITIKQLKVVEKLHHVSDTDKTIVGKLADNKGNVIDVRIHKTIAENAEFANLLTFEVNKFVNAVAVVSAYKGNPQIAYLELTAVELSPEEKIAKAKEVVLGFNNKEFNMDTEVTLPEQIEALGATIQYTYNPADAVANGKWKVVTADESVNVTANVIVGSLSEQVTLTVKIKFVSPNQDKDITIDFSKKPTIKNNENFAAAVGLDENLINVNFSKGSNLAKVYDNVLRMYKGNILTVEIKGKRIKKVIFEFVKGNKTGNTEAEFVFGANPVVKKTGAELTQQLILEANDVEKFTFENKGGTTSQIHYTSIKIFYAD